MNIFKNHLALSIFLLLTASLFLASCNPKKTGSHLSSASNKDKATFFFVRHADKVGKTDALSMRGLKRANDLKELLKDQSIKAIYTSDYNRTKNTILPLANSINVSYEIYNPRNLDELTQMALPNINKNKNVLIVGHSNTIPETIKNFYPEMEAFTIDHDEYNKLFSLIFTDNPSPTFRVESYGD